MISISAPIMLSHEAPVESERGNMYFYIAREVLPSLILFSVAFVSLGLVTLSLFFVWYAGEQGAMLARLSTEHHKESHYEFKKDRRKQCLDTD